MNWQVAVARPDGLGESPFWHPLEQRLYWLDIAGRKARRWHPASGAEESWELPQDPGCMAPARKGGLVLALRDGIYRAPGWGGTLAPVALFGHGGHSRFNDGKCDPQGRLWAGTIYEPRDARKADLFCIDCRPDNGAGGKPLVQLKAHNATTANGLAFSPAQDRLYWADTPRHLVQAWDWEPGANVLRNHREFLRVEPKPAGWKPGDAGYGGRPDGAAVDAEGCYWCAMYEGGRVLRIAPDGRVLTSLELPARCPTMPCFGGPELKTLYVTSARDGRPADELQALPQSGCVFATQVEVPGLPVNFFID
ncbi:MAG TPA: SMP-30/gluconolactonase/LRE family protein [Ramlibacter sp.]|nr:SMP-30/gluconolactonase/LRE family protein [Ramlibacter sp.]